MATRQWAQRTTMNKNEFLCHLLSDLKIASTDRELMFQAPIMNCCHLCYYKQKAGRMNEI
jgi:hypothetical protein